MWLLYTRAWLLDITFTLSRFVMVYKGLGIYRTPDCIINAPKAESDAYEQEKFYKEQAKPGDLENWDSCIHYNLDLMGDYITIFRVLLWSTLGLTLLLDILCYKYRKLAQYYLYIHVLHLIFIRMLPNAEGQYISVQPVQFGYVFFGLNVLFYCDQSRSVILQPIMFMWHFFFTSPFIYFKDMTLMFILVIVWLISVLVFGLFLTAAGIRYIFQLQSKIAQTNAENIRLLDGMHEGVLILHKRTNDIIFCNKPAQQLLSRFILAHKS